MRIRRRREISEIVFLLPEDVARQLNAEADRDRNADSIASLLGYGLFSAAAFFSGLISTSALAAHKIAHQVVILFVIPFGIGMAAVVRVWHAIGRNDGPGVKRAGLVAMLLGIVIAAILTLAVMAACFEITELFLDESTGNAEAMIGLAAKLLLVGASFCTTQAAQSIAQGSLRGGLSSGTTAYAALLVLHFQLLAYRLAHDIRRY